MKLPLPSWKDRLPRRRKTADTAAAAEPVAGAHRKKKKTRKLKKKVVIPLAVVGVAGIAFGVHHVLTAGATDIVQTFTESEATRQDIMRQFVIEAGTTSALGGVIGIVFGAVVALALGQAIGIDATPSVMAVGVSFGVSVAIGVFFGFMPARKAAKLNPIDALRYD